MGEPNPFRPTFRAEDAGEKKTDQPKPLTEKERVLQEARGRYQDFAKRLEKTIAGYFGTSAITFTCEPGGWYIDLENLRVNADPQFFLEKGFAEGECLFGTFHEAEHFRDMIQDSEAYSYLFTRLNTRTDVGPGYPGALKALYNCLDDVLVNKVVMNRWAAGKKVVDGVYPKLFPTNDFRTSPKDGTPQPRHRQLMYALLRGAMLPDEPPIVDPEVQEAIDAWQARGGSRKALDVITAVDRRGHGYLSPDDRFARIQQTLEPVFEALYKKDLEDRKESEKKKDKQGVQGEEGEEGDPFDDDPFADGIPDPVDFEKTAEQAKKINKKIAENKAKAFKERMGVEKKDLDAYTKDYQKVKPYIEELSHIFDEVIQRRKSYRRVLKKSVREGPLLDPRKGATAIAEVRAGNLEPRVFLDYEARERIQNVPSEIEFTVVCDGSGSMVGNAKEKMQRQLAVLATEAFADFRERIAKERRRGENITLKVKSEVREFSDKDKVLKPLSESLTHQERVAMHKELKNLSGGGNNEPETFQAMLREQFKADTCKKLVSGTLKKIIVFLTDGQTDSAAIQNEIRSLMARAGTDKAGKSNLVIAGIGFEDGVQAVETYAPNGYFTKDVSQVPKIFGEFLKKILEDV